MLKICFLSFALAIYCIGCGLRNNKVEVETNDAREVYENIFGERYLVANGSFLDQKKDRVETGLWQYTSLERTFVFFGNYTNGLPTGEWTFLLSDGVGLTSQWDVYSNKLGIFSFSVPFALLDSTVDATMFKLTTLNDSLGKVTIIVNVDDKLLTKEERGKFDSESEIGIREQGYTFEGRKRQIKKRDNEYFFDEYLLKDSLNKPAKLYRLYGNDPQKKYFVEFTLFHAGPKVDLVKAIYSLMATSLYIGKGRFLNPYVLSE